MPFDAIIKFYCFYYCLNKQFYVILHCCLEKQIIFFRHKGNSTAHRRARGGTANPPPFKPNSLWKSAR